MAVTSGEEARWKQHKDTECYSKHNEEAFSPKTAAIRSHELCQDMLGTAGEAETNALAMFSGRPSHMDIPMLADERIHLSVAKSNSR